MRTTIDKAGRLVVPLALREALGLSAGVVDLEVDGASLRLRPVTEESLTERGGRLLIPAGSGKQIDDEQMHALRDAARR